MAQELCHLFNMIWNSGTVQDEWRKRMIVRLPKKGDLSNCKDWQGITLLSVPGKVLSKFKKNKQDSEVEDHAVSKY